MIKNGIITTVAGNGQPTDAGDGQLATHASLGNVYGVAVDGSGNLYLAEVSTIRMVDATTGIINVIAGNGVHGYSGDGGDPTKAQIYAPWGMCIDNTGRLFMAESQNACVRVVH